MRRRGHQSGVWIDCDRVLNVTDVLVKVEREQNNEVKLKLSVNNFIISTHMERFEDVKKNDK